MEQGSERERESTVCIRFTQVESKGPHATRQVTAKDVQAEVLSLVNNIREQCFQQAENFVSGDIRYQGFEDREGIGKGMITFKRRTASLFEVDVAIGCLLSWVLPGQWYPGPQRSSLQVVPILGHHGSNIGHQSL